ncbi:MAG: hypothetical protein K0S65_1292, partial [Labilithrix sp.]|nr:hypothetical protein [Labilithrix sp.]
MRIFPKPLRSSLWLASVTLATAPALAEESEPERLFREARSAMLEGRFDEACPKLEESQRLDPHVGTLLNLAACHERQGKIASAWVEYQKAHTAAQAEGQADRARLAEQRIAVIEHRLPWLRVAVRGDSAGMTVSLDGSELSAAALGTEMPVDPGAHVISGQRPGARGFEERIELREGEHRTVTVVLEPPTPSSGDEPPTSRSVEPSSPARNNVAKGRWVFEPGVYLAYVRGGGGDQPAPSSEAAESIMLERMGSGERTNCLEQPGCSYGARPITDTTSTGLNLFGGYALSERVEIGLRLIVGPMLSGGVLVVFGPQISFRPTRALKIGAFAVAGSATLPEVTPVAAPTGFVAPQSGSDGERRIGGAGVGFELALRILELERG